MSTVTGNQAEVAAADYLKKYGFKIRDRNWRTRVCEIDIIAEKNRTVYFVEVKYRQTSRQGSGLDYITAKKLKQMQFAAEVWVAENNWQNDYCVSAAEVSADFQVTEFIESIS